MLPALLDQSSVDGPGTAWVLLSVWAVGSLGFGLFMVVRPVVATAGCFLTLATVELTASALDVELSFLDLAPTAACLFMAGALASGRVVAVVGSTVLIGTLVGTVLNRLTADAGAQGGLDVLAGLLTLALVLVAGLVLRAQRETAAVTRQTLDVERRLRVLAESEAAARERAWIAREMHDVVAHSVTLLVLNAETLQARRAELPDWASAQADAMADAGRRAGGEMRAMLELLRTDDPPGPVPGLGDLPMLVEEAGRAGTSVSSTVDGSEVPVPATTALTAYRVAQECLSNARRHAPESPVSIRLIWRPDDLTVEVTTYGGGNGSSEGAGAGLAWMRERVAECGGLFRADPSDDTHRVVVTLPTGALGG